VDEKRAVQHWRPTQTRWRRNGDRRGWLPL
jgi:hypothetical protein